MKIAILSRSVKVYSTQRIRSAALARGHHVRVMNPRHFSIYVEEREPGLKYRSALQRIDAVIPRIAASLTYFGTALVRQFEQMGIFALNSANAISVSRDKLRAAQVLSRHDIGMPPTAFVRDRKDILPAIEHVGGVPVVIKLLEGTQGIGVILAETISIAEAIIQTLQSKDQNVLIQKFVAESRGRDVRALVVGNRVVAAMRRVAQGQEFRSNVHRGGKTEAIELDDHYSKTAVHAAHIMGLHVAGVDMLESSSGPQIMEVNSSPGLEGVEKISGVDIAGAIIEHLEDQVSFPDVDYRQRLSLGKGYNVVEIAIARQSDLRDKSIAESGLAESEVQVLSITRAGHVIPLPRADEKFLLGDILVCFGKQLALKSLVAPAAKRNRKNPASFGQPDSKPTK